MTATIDPETRQAMVEELALFIQLNAASIAAGAMERMTGGSPPPGDDTEEPTAKDRRREALRYMRTELGRTGGSFRELLSDSYARVVEAEFLAAETACRGHMLSTNGEDQGANPRELWRVSLATAKAWASKELLDHWEEHGRTTAEEYRRWLLDDVRGARAWRTSRAVVT